MILKFIHYVNLLEIMVGLEIKMMIAQYLRKGQLVILESTTYPGTTEEEILPILSQTGLKVGEGFFLGYSPEWEDPGNKKFSTATIPKVISGITKMSCTY